MKKNREDLAYFGGKKSFDAFLPVGQINVPRWEKFEEMVEGIFHRKYYSHHGPLAQEFEEKLCSFLKVKHCVTITNATIALMISLKALNLPARAKILVPAYTFAASVQAITWAGYEPIFCDVDRKTHLLCKDEVLKHIDKTHAILAVHLWGNACNIEELEELSARYKVPLLFDAAHAIGNIYKGRYIGNFGRAEIFSFHATKILSCAEGGAIATNDDAFAETVRNLRSSHGRREQVPVSINCNGRFSEFQAAMGLLSLEEFYENCEQNRIKICKYKDLLSSVRGIKILTSRMDFDNAQYLVLEIDEKLFGLSRDQLSALLHSENILSRKYFTPGMHKVVPYKDDFPEFMNALPVTDELSKCVMQLPSGRKVKLEDIEKICELIVFINKNAHRIREKI